MVCEGELECLVASPGDMPQTIQTDDCVDVAFRGQGKGKGKSQLKSTLNSDGLAKKIVKEVSDREAEVEIFVASPGPVPQTMQTADCVGDALRGQGKGRSQLKLTLNSDGLVNKIVQEVTEFEAEAEIFDASPGAVLTREHPAAAGGRQLPAAAVAAC